MSDNQENTSMRAAIFGVPVAFICVCGFIALGMWGCPTYSVYQQRMAGEAELANAQYSKQVAVQTAQAKKDSAQLLADTEVIRASGVAKANAIIAQGLGGPEGYLRYLYIQMLQEQQDKQIIYVPTEANLPILEAGRLASPKP